MVSTQHRYWAVLYICFPCFVFECKQKRMINSFLEEKCFSSPTSHNQAHADIQSHFSFQLVFVYFVVFFRLCERDANTNAATRPSCGAVGDHEAIVWNASVFQKTTLMEADVEGVHAARDVTALQSKQRANVACRILLGSNRARRGLLGRGLGPW